jgi:hypothetical protein
MKKNISCCRYPYSDHGDRYALAGECAGEYISPGGIINLEFADTPQRLAGAAFSVGILQR